MLLPPETAHTVAVNIVAKNRRAHYDYEILETLEAGIILSGQEAKSCRQGHVNVSGAYVSFFGGKPLLKNASIAPYTFAGTLSGYEPGRDRVLLLSKTEIRKLESSLAEKGVSLIPLEVRAGRCIKVLLGLARGRKRHDKRQRIRERDTERRIRQTGDD